MPKVELFTESFTGTAGSAPDTAKWTRKLMSSAVIENAGGDHLRIAPGGTQLPPIMRTTVTANGLKTGTAWASGSGIFVTQASDVEIGDLLIATVSVASVNTATPDVPVISSTDQRSWSQISFATQYSTDSGRTTAPRVTSACYYRFATATDVATRPVLRFTSIGITASMATQCAAVLSLTAIGRASIPRMAVQTPPSSGVSSAAGYSNVTQGADDYQFNVVVATRSSASATTMWANSVSTGYDLSTIAATGNGSTSHYSTVIVSGMSTGISPNFQPQISSANSAGVSCFFQGYTLTFTGSSGLYGSTSTNPTYEIQDSSAYIRAYDLTALLPTGTTSQYKAVTFSVGPAIWMLTKGAEGTKLRGVIGSMQTGQAYLDYNPTTHAWLRVRCVFNNPFNDWYWDTAPDSNGAPGSWTNQGGVLSGITPVFCGHTDAYPKILFPNTQGETYFDNLNVPTGAWVPVVDTTPPAVPTFSAAKTAATTVTFTWNSDPDVATYEVFRNGSSIGTYARTTYPTGATYTAAQGSATYTVRAQDSALNWSAQSSPPITVVIDTTAPTNPGTPTVSASGRAITVNWTASTDALTPPVTYTLTRNAGGAGVVSAATFSGLATNSYVDTLPGDDLVTYKVQAFDQAGNGSTVSANSATIIGSTAPLVSDITDDFSGAVLDAGKWTPSVPASSSITVDVPTGRLAITKLAAAPSTNAYMDAVPQYLDARNTSFYARIFEPTSLPGANDNTRSYTMQVGTAAMRIMRPIASGILNLRLSYRNTSNTLVNVDTVTYDSTAHAWWRINHTLTQVTFWAAPDNNGAPGTYTQVGGIYSFYLPSGDDTVHSRIIFNVNGTQSTSSTWYIDNVNVPTGAYGADLTPPTIPTVSASAVGTSVTVSWNTNADVALYEVFLDGVTQGTTAATSLNQTLTDGTYTYTVRARDAFGNWSAQSTGSSVTVDTTPPDVPVITTVIAVEHLVTVSWSSSE